MVEEASVCAIVSEDDGDNKAAMIDTILLVACGNCVNPDDYGPGEVPERVPGRPGFELSGPKIVTHDDDIRMSVECRDCDGTSFRLGSLARGMRAEIVPCSRLPHEHELPPGIRAVQCVGHLLLRKGGHEWELALIMRLADA